MHTWPALRAERSDLADAVDALLYQVGVGLAFLSTVRRDGGPRVHPMCPIIREDGLYALLVPSPKADDLRRDPRYALHSFPCDTNEDAAYLTGHVIVHDDAGALRAAIDDQFLAERKMTERPPGFGDSQLVELLIDTCMVTRTTGHGDPHPRHTIWHADGARS